MATRKTAIAPAAPIPQGDAIDAWLNDLDSNIIDVRAKCDQAYKEGMSKGFDSQLAAAEAINVTYDVLAAWQPKDARVIGDRAEDRIRDAHLKSEPQSSWLALKQAKDLLALVSNASEPSVVETVRAKRKILPVRAKGEAAEGKKVLQGLRDDAAKAKDTDRVASLDTHLKAVGNADRIIELCKDAQLVEKANSRWRARLYLPHVTPLMTAGKVPTADYEKICAVAAAAHKGIKETGQTRTAKLVKATIETAVTDFIGVEYGTKVKDVRPNSVIGKAACVAIFRNTRLAAKMGELQENVRDEIINWLVNGAGLADPDVKVSKTPAAAPVSRKAREKVPAKLKTAPAKPPRAKKEAAPTPPPSVVPVATTAAGSNIAELMDETA